MTFSSWIKSPSLTKAEQELSVLRDKNERLREYIQVTVDCWITSEVPSLRDMANELRKVLEKTK
jgi:hypothetical protein